MKQEHFIARREQRWERYRALLKSMRSGHKSLRTPAQFPALYRGLCNDLALARTRGYSLNLINRLQEWILQGHALLYRPHRSLTRDAVRFFRQEFPGLVRAEWRLTLVCSLLLFGPIVWLFWQIGTTPEFVYRVLDPDTVVQVEQMYARDAGPGRDAETEVFMFAFYIMNNIGVALRTFAGGLVFGLGSVLILLFNGTQIGAVAAHLSFEGYHESFWSFVIGHGAFELPAIVLAGVAGARMGLSLLMPGNLRRIDALRRAAGRAVKLLYGVVAMLLLAAGLEAFWSGSGLAANLKYGIGGALWLAVVAYFALVGHTRAPDRDRHAD